MAIGQGIEVVEGQIGSGQQRLDHRHHALGVLTGSLTALGSNNAVLPQGNGTGGRGCIDGQKRGHGRFVVRKM
ncbi:hypothetical protein CLAM6_29900 [Cobetia sp. AM6]|nr:hypothetical protein CLAM6_29900 [Cobetia sp. AM6]